MAGARKKIFITMGDIHGIGPEVVLKALVRLHPQNQVVFCLIGEEKVLDFYRGLLQIELPLVREEGFENPAAIYFVAEASMGKRFLPGTVSRHAGGLSAAFIRRGVEYVKRDPRAALITAPISKEALWRAGNLFPGQTEMIAHLLQVNKFAMMLVSGEFRVAFVTTHHPFRKIPSLLTIELLVEKCLVVREDLRRRFRIKKPRIAVAALNPHGGENGALGTEEKKVIIPAVQLLREKGLNIDGPFPSDTLFTKFKLHEYDAFLALYHDQGMIPIKMHSFGKAVNYTAGLPIVRTSPDHGTAFDIAAKGVADESSMVEAIKLAITLVNQKDAKGSPV